MRDDLGHREALLGVPDRRREDLLHRKLPEFPVQLEPPVDAAGHGLRQHPRVGHRSEAAGANLVDREETGRPAARVDPVEPLRFRVPDDGEEIAADPARDGLHEPERGVHGDRRVDGVPARLEYVDADLHRERLRRADHAVIGGHLGARGEHLSGRPVETAGRFGEKSRAQGEHHDRLRFHRGPAPAQRSSHASNSPYQYIEFCGVSTQWFSSGKHTSFAGTPRSLSMPYTSRALPRGTR